MCGCVKWQKCVACIIREAEWNPFLQSLKAEVIRQRREELLALEKAEAVAEVELILRGANE